ncbi:hypothetical protein, partial [uncultured Duncaniella sp.]
ISPCGLHCIALDEGLPSYRCFAACQLPSGTLHPPFASFALLYLFPSNYLSVAFATFVLLYPFNQTAYFDLLYLFYNPNKKYGFRT